MSDVQKCWNSNQVLSQNKETDGGSTNSIIYSSSNFTLGLNPYTVFFEISMTFYILCLLSLHLMFKNKNVLG